MSQAHLIRLSGLCAIIGGVAIVLARVLQVALFGSQPLSNHASQAPFIPAVGVPGYAGGVFLLLGVIGLYARQARRLGALGVISFAIAFVGISLSNAANWVYAFGSPLLARLDPQLLSSEFLDERWGSLGPAILVSYLSGGLGWLLLGVITLVAKELPIWVGLTMIISMGLAALLPFDTAGPSAILLNLLIAAGPIAFGYALWAGQPSVGSAYR